MNQDMQNARAKLASGQFTCVLCRDDHTITSTARGVRPLVELLETGTLSGYSAADKVVGKATAFLYVLLKVRAVYAPVMSHPAIAVLDRYGIEVSYDTATDRIFNRDRSGFCPMETAVQGIETPEQARDAVLAALKTGIHRT